MGKRGPKPQEKCVAGHDLTKPDNVAVVSRSVKGKVYKERQCRPCRQKRSRDWWRANRGKAT